MSKGNTPRTLWEIMINSPDVLQLCSSSVHFTIKFYKASRHPAGCIHCEMAFSMMAFCSVSVVLHYSLPPPSVAITYFLLDTANHIFLDVLGFRTEFYLFKSEKKKTLPCTERRSNLQLTASKNMRFPSIFELVFACDCDCNFPLKWLSLDSEALIYTVQPKYVSDRASSPVSLPWDLRYPKAEHSYLQDRALLL